jgi:hypothetical protein
VQSWQPGDSVVLRYFSRGRPSGALPTRLVSNGGDRALWVPSGTPLKWAGLNGRHIREAPLRERFTQPWSPIDRPWTGDGVLILGRPGRAHSIWLFRDDGRFAGWYVNLEAPWRPYRHGFDTEDHALDIWVEGDGSWRWKDEDELAVAVDVGFFTPAQAEAFRAEGECVVAEWPFPTGWEEWQADPAWPLLELPPDWDA